MPGSCKETHGRVIASCGYDVQAQIDAIQAQRQEERRQQLRARRHAERSQRKPLPRSEPRTDNPLPLANHSDFVPRPNPPKKKGPTLEQRLAVAPITPPVPRISRPIDLDFTKKSPAEIQAIISNKIGATVIRLQAIFDKKEPFEQLPVEHQKALHHLAYQLNWASENCDNSHQWDIGNRKHLVWACTSIGKVEFSIPGRPLISRYRQVAQELVYIAQGGYLDWIDKELGIRPLYIL